MQYCASDIFILLSILEEVNKRGLQANWAEKQVALAACAALAKLEPVPVQTAEMRQVSTPIALCRF